MLKNIKAWFSGTPGTKWADAAASGRQAEIYKRLGMEGDLNTPITQVLHKIIDRIERLEAKVDRKHRH